MDYALNLKIFFLILWMELWTKVGLGTPVGNLKRLEHLTKITERKDIIEDPIKMQSWATQVVEHQDDALSDYVGSVNAETSKDNTAMNFRLEDFSGVVEDFCQDECEWEHHPSDPYYYIPYQLSTFYSKEETNKIVEFLDYLSEATNFKFIEYKGENITGQYAPYYIHIFSGPRCWSRVGRWVKRGVQIMSLETKTCTNPAAMLHEFAHLFGLNHEHRRPDRNLYIKIINSNIDDSHVHEFPKVPFPKTRLGQHLSGYKYDIASIMHYNSVAFSKSGGVTIVSRDKQWRSSLRYSGTMMSTCDWNKILTLYPGLKKPPECIPNSRGWQYVPTEACYQMYGHLNCQTACHYVGGDLIKSNICNYNSETGKPVLPQNLQRNPYFQTDADFSKSGNENFWRAFLVRVNHVSEILFI